MVTLTAFRLMEISHARPSTCPTGQLRRALRTSTRYRWRLLEDALTCPLALGNTWFLALLVYLVNFECLSEHVQPPICIFLHTAVMRQHVRRVDIYAIRSTSHELHERSDEDLMKQKNRKTYVCAIFHPCTKVHVDVGPMLTPSTLRMYIEGIL